MQGLGKFVTPTEYFHTVHGHNKHIAETDLYAWEKEIESQLEKITKQLKKTPHHSNVGSCIFPPIPSNGVVDCLEEKDNDNVDVVEQKVSNFCFPALVHILY